MLFLRPRHRFKHNISMCIESQYPRGERRYYSSKAARNIRACRRSPTSKSFEGMYGHSHSAYTDWWKCSHLTCQCELTVQLAGWPYSSSYLAGYATRRFPIPFDNLGFHKMEDLHTELHSFVYEVNDFFLFFHSVRKHRRGVRSMYMNKTIK